MFSTGSPRAKKAFPLTLTTGVSWSLCDSGVSSVPSPIAAKDFAMSSSVEVITAPSAIVHEGSQ